jgi:hypothetical protein
MPKSAPTAGNTGSPSRRFALPSLARPLAFRAVWHLALFGIRAVWHLAPFGIPRRSALAPFGISRPSCLAPFGRAPFWLLTVALPRC